MKKIKVGVAGGAGYTGGELIRLLRFHPAVELAFVQSNSQAGKSLTAVHPDLFELAEMQFSPKISEDIDLLFLCMGHGDSAKFLAAEKISPAIKIIDLSQDFRHKRAGNDFVYGLPELNREAIRQAQKIANPGCFATAIQLALLPLADAAQLNSDIQVSAITGSTGAGQSLSPTTHFSWRNNNASVYKALTHQHLTEIRQSLNQLQADFASKINFIPFRGNFSRGILVALHLPWNTSLTDARDTFNGYYQNHPFVQLSKTNPDLKRVVNTNHCLLYLEKHDDTLLVVSVIDNLLKGASGQAVQNMNLLFDLPEHAGLQLKSVAF